MPSWKSSNVFLRHRLLRKPGGFEGFLPRKEAVGFEDLAVAHQEVDRELLVELDAGWRLPGGGMPNYSETIESP